MSSVSTFGIFQALLTKAVTNDTTLDAGTKASMLTRINELARTENLLFDSSNVASTAGSCSVATDTSSIEVAIGSTGTNRVVWNPETFTVPVDIDGTGGDRGFLPGHGGQSAHALVALTGISLQYRLSASGAWQPFTRNTLLRGVTYIQFAANIADQVAVLALPQVNILAYQV